jgi:hypothetical protein
MNSRGSPPNFFKLFRTFMKIDSSVLNIPMTHVNLNGSEVVSFIYQSGSASMAK